MLRETPPLPPQIKPPRLRGAQEEVGGGGEAGFALLRLRDALQLQTQAGSSEELARALNCSAEWQGDRMRKDTCARRAIARSGRGVQRVLAMQIRPQSQGLGRTRHSYV